jgi:TatD DNase family protein
VVGIFDTHTHLDNEAFAEDQAEVISRARAAGVSRMLSVGAGRGLVSAQAVIELTERYDFIFASAGVHPHDAGMELRIQTLSEYAKHPRVVAIGETGLDFYRDWAPVDKQYEWFVAQIRLALEVQKPLIIHSRDAGSECLQLLREHDAKRVGGVFHCFAEDAAFAHELMDIGFLVSFPGTVTFKNAQQVRDVVQAVPLDQIMLETDAPYMAPVPHRGKRCESSFIVETARVVADVKGVSFEVLVEQTTANALRLFKIEQ